MRLQDAEPRSRFQRLHTRSSASSSGDVLTAKTTQASVTATKKRILIKRAHELRSISIIAHQQTANRSIIVKSLFISIASFDCFSLLIVRGGLWPPARSHCHLCWQAALVHGKLESDVSVTDAEREGKRTGEWGGGGGTLSRLRCSDSSLVRKKTAFTAFLKESADASVGTAS